MTTGSKKMFSNSFGGSRFHAGDVFSQHVYFHGFVRKSSFIRSTVLIMPNASVSGIVRIANMRGYCFIIHGYHKINRANDSLTSVLTQPWFGPGPQFSVLCMGLRPSKMHEWGERSRVRERERESTGEREKEHEKTRERERERERGRERERERDRANVRRGFKIN